jgi:hypothetical protein
MNLLEDGSTFSWGSGMAFLIGGPVTALPAMAVFLSLFKPRVFWLYLGICLSGTLIVAFRAAVARSGPACDRRGEPSGPVRWTPCPGTFSPSAGVAGVHRAQGDCA